jgi:hypothetical protein
MTRAQESVGRTPAPARRVNDVALASNNGENLTTSIWPKNPSKLYVPLTQKHSKLYVPVTQKPQNRTEPIGILIRYNKLRKDIEDSFLDDHHGASVPQHDHLRARDFDVNRAKGLV